MRVWMLPLRLAWALVALVCLVTLAHLPGWIGPVACAVSLFTAWRPAEGLLIAAAFAPLGSALGALVSYPGNLSEPLVLTAVAGGALRAASRPDGAIRSFSWPAALLAVVIAASYAVQLWVRRAFLGQEQFGREIARLLAGEYLTSSLDLGPLRPAAVFVEGLALFAIASAVVAGRRERLASLVRAMAAGATGAAALNVLRLANIAIATGDPWQALPQFLSGTRINVHFADVNAAGSYFALMLGAVLGLFFAERPRLRAIWAACGSLLAAALWLTSSRAALVALLAVAGISVLVAVITRRSELSRRAVTVSLIVLLGAAAATVAFLPNRLTGPGASLAIEVRHDMAVVAMRLLRSRPVFGIGVGNFYEASGEELARLPVGRFYQRENAHNNYLQILAELGVFGFAAFSFLLWTAGRRLKSSLHEDSSSLWLVAAGLSAGVAAFLVSALLGHPLLTPECAYAFWLATGGIAGYCGGETLPGAARRATAVLALAVLLSVPPRAVAAVRNADLEHVGYGVSGWQTAPDGMRYRIASAQGTIYVPADARLIEIPLRAARSVQPVPTVSIFLDGRLIDRVLVRADAWTPYRLVLPLNSSSKYRAITFAGSTADVSLQIGKTIILQPARRD